MEPGNWLDIPTIERIPPDAREYADRIPTGPLPGSGQRNDDCGDSIPALLCPETGCGEVYEPGRTCRRSRCPRCWQSWAFRRATTRAAQIESLGRKRGSDRTNVKQHHLTVSFRDSTRFNSKAPLDRAVAVVKRLAREVNMDTGIIIYHPYRIAEEYRGSVSGHRAGRGDMTWADVLGKVEDEDWTWKAVEHEFLTYAPHFHVIGLSEFVQTGAVVDEIEAKTGAVIHRITAGDSSVSIYELEDLCRTMAYAVSHAGLQWNDGSESWESVIRPFGEVANFSAYDNVIAETKATMREVAPDVLGVEFPEPRCSAERANTDHADRGDDEQAQNAPSAVRVVWRDRGHSSSDGFGHGHGDDEATSDEWDAGVRTGFTQDTSDSWTAGAGHVPAFMQDATDAKSEDTEQCRGRLVPMWAADEYIGDDDWIATLDPPRRKHVREKYREWVELGKPVPEDVPGTEAGPPPVD